MRNSETFAIEAREKLKQIGLENRDPTPEESGEIETLLERSREARQAETKSLGDAVQFGGGMPPARIGGGLGFGGPGDQFIRSKGYQRVRSADTRGEIFTSGKVEVNLSTKATLLSGGTVGGYGPYQQAVPGVVPVAEQPVMVPDLIPSVPATTADVRFYKERIATNAAGGVAEGAEKPESTFDFEEQSAALKKIATFLPVSDEFLEDAPSVQNYLNTRLAQFVRIEEEQQLLRGTATSDVTGFIDNYALNSVGSATISGASGTAVFGDLLTVFNNQRGSSYLDPDAIVMHPTQFGSILSFYDAQGQYYSGGALTAGAYGGGNVVQSSPFSTGVSLWGVRAVVTTAIGAGTMLVGNFRQGAQVYRRGGISVEASNAHEDFFRRNLLAIRAEERLALCVLRPEAYTVVTW